MCESGRPNAGAVGSSTQRRCARTLAYHSASGADTRGPVFVCVVERPGHGRYKLPTLKTAPRLPRTQEWKRSSAWKASSYPKRGTMSKEAFFSTTDWKSDPYSLKWEKEWEYRQMIESKVLFGNFLPPSGDKTLRTRSSKITSQPTQAFWAGTPKGH